MMETRVYSEIGFGNDTFLSTEIEKGKTEIRKKGFILPKMIREFYLRIWINYTVLIISTRDGLKLKKKDKIRYKLIFGIGGSGLK